MLDYDNLVRRNFFNLTKSPGNEVETVEVLHDPYGGR